MVLLFNNNSIQPSGGYGDDCANKSLSNLDDQGNAKFSDKQDVLVSGTNIKTINSLSILGSGNIEISESGTISIDTEYDPTSTNAQSGTAVAEGLSVTANKDLSNLSSDGQMIIDSQNGTISNCILEIPQNLKLEIVNNAPVIKAGSIVTLTGSTYATLTTTADSSVGTLANTDGEYFLTMSGIANVPGVGTFIAVNKSYSGNSSGYPTQNLDTATSYYNTDEKKWYRWTSSGWTELTRYPLAIVKRENGVWSFAKDSNGNDMIFNDIGFIGHHIFRFPNRKELAPDGFNTDGSLKSRLITANAVRISEMSVGESYTGIKRAIASTSLWSGYIEVENYEDADFSKNWLRYYIKNENKTYVYNGTQIVIVDNEVCEGWFYYDGTTVTDFTICQPVRTATTEMLDKIQSQVDTNTTAISGKQDTLVSGTNIKTINSTSVLGSGDITVANQSLSNLDNTGQLTVDSQNGTISNCILKIPQNLNLTLENNVLTLKSGSVLTLQGSTYQTSTTTVDRTYTISDALADGTYYIFTTSSGVIQAPKLISLVESGNAADIPDVATAPTGYTYYAIDEKIIYYKGSGVWTQWKVVYPLCIITISSGVANFAKDTKGNNMVFNSCCFLGRARIYYPGIKFLAAYGFNADGTLRSRERTTSSVIVVNYLNVTDGYDGLNVIQDSVGNGNYVYDEKTNYVYNGSISSSNLRDFICPFVHLKYENNIFTDFTIRQPIKTATIEMLNKKQDTLTFDSTPTDASTNPITSGGVYTALNGKQDNITTISGYDATKTQTLTNVNGVLTWINN